MEVFTEDGVFDASARGYKVAEGKEGLRIHWRPPAIRSPTTSPTR